MQNRESFPSDDLSYYAALIERRFIYATSRMRWKLRKTNNPRVKAMFDKSVSILHLLLKAYVQDLVERYHAFVLPKSK